MRNIWVGILEWLFSDTVLVAVIGLTAISFVLGCVHTANWLFVTVACMLFLMVVQNGD